MEENCIFCKIIKGELPSFKIYEDDDYLALLDISQFTAGHTIVIPKRHVKSIWELEDIGGFMKVVQKIGRHYKDLGFEYVDVMVFGRLVHHLHVHLIPNNSDSKEYYAALSKIGEMQGDHERWPNKEKGEQLVSKLKL